MGGVAGHMSHLHEDPELTFKEIKDVFAMASNGELEGTEKTDGQNLFISYSVQTGRAKAARNKGNIKSGGMTAEELAQKFAGRGALESAFVDSFKTFEKAVQSLDPEAQMAIFGPNADIYYNAEIQDPRTANIINYDTKTLNIHQVGHAEFDRESGTIKDIDVSKNVRALDRALGQMQSAIEKEEYNVQRNAIKRLRGLDDDRALNDAVERLEKEINKYGISDRQTISDYIIAKIVPFIEKQVELPEKNKKLLVKRIFGVKGVGFNQVVKGLDRESKEIVRGIVKSSKDLLKNSTLQIEDIIHDFAVEMLKGLHSAFILDNTKEVIRLRNKVSQAIQAIEASDNAEALKILQLQMRKLKSIEGISTAVEGFVFDYNGKTYKFTGNFAPANQILGLFRYGRGNVPALQSLDEEGASEGLYEADLDLCDELIAVIPGAFKPPHRGHYDMIEHYSNIVGPAGKVHVMISPLSASERKGFDPETQADVGVQQSLSLWEMYTSNLSNVVITVSSMRSPVRAAYEFTGDDGYLLGTECVILGASTKGGDQARFARDVQAYAKEGVRVMNPMEYAFDPKEQLNATNMRQAAKDQNIDALLSFLPKHALQYQDEIIRLFGISEGGPAEMTLEEQIVKLVESEFQKKMKKRLKKAHSDYLDGGPQDPGSSFPEKRQKVSNAFLAKENEELEETSSVVGGNITGHAAATYPGLDVEKENEDEKKKSHTLEEDVLAEQDEELEGSQDFDTVADLLKAIKTHSLKQKGGEIGKKAARFLIGMIPGGGAGLELFDKAKDANDFFKNIYGADDSFKTNSALDNLNVDDDISKIVDDPIEVAFLKDFIAGLKGREEEPLANLSVTRELQIFIADKFNKKTVSQSSVSETLSEEAELVEGVMNYLLRQNGAT